MKQSISGATLINLIVIFIVIIFGLLAATFSYAKAYKINTRIMNGIEIYGGYNKEALSYIDVALKGYGYTRGKKTCPGTLVMNGATGILDSSASSDYYFCVYKFTTTTEGKCYYSYGVVTYISFELPIVGKFDVPVKSKTNRIFDFKKDASANC